jgi:SAM-dependent methyltransferase
MIPVCRVFEDYANDYDRWFDEHHDVYEAQLRMLHRAVPRHGLGLEVGVGSGRFAVPLDIGYGIDPSRELLKMAKSRGIEVVLGEGEHLPYGPESFLFVLMMTVICFLDNVGALFREAGRVLIPGGTLIVGFIERGGVIEEMYRNEKTKGRFLRYARFWTVAEVTRFIENAGFTNVTISQRSRGFCVIKGQKQ